MPIPFLFVGAAAVMGAAGVGKTVKAGKNQSQAKAINTSANEQIKEATERLDFLRKECGTSLQNLGEEKVFVLNGSIKYFLDSFSKLKNVDFEESEGIMELNKLHIDQKFFDDLGEMSKFSFSLVKGAASGVTGGAIAAFGAYSAAATFASASTSTAIASLGGAAATNATLAFFGGGSLAAGGMGIAGGTAVLGGIVAGPALLVMGVITGAKAGKELENAKANAAKAIEICAQLESGGDQCIAIRRRTNMFYNLLARMDAYLMPLVYEMEGIIEKEGVDYSQFTESSKQTIARVVSATATVKAILDTPILTDDGDMTEESESVATTLLDEVDEKESFSN